MHAFLGLIIVCLAVATHGLPSQTIDGKNAPVGKFPYQVSLRENNIHFCSGSIINVRSILTAAHCVINYKKAESISRLTIHVGTILLNETGTVYNATKAVSHNEFNGYYNDIAIIILSSDIVFNDVVQPIQYARNNVVPVGQPCVLSGWGITSYHGKDSNNLQEFELNVYDQDECQQVYWRVNFSHICAFSQFGQGLCHGDSGAALVANGVQIGILSFGKPCIIRYPDYFTRVSAFQDWIKTTLSDNNVDV